MSEQNQNPVEPGWGHQPGDPEDVERWWTGAEWSEYTRPAPGTNESATAPSAVDEDQTVGDPDAESDAGVDESEAAEAFEGSEVADVAEVVEVYGAADDTSVLQQAAIVDDQAGGQADVGDAYHGAPSSVGGSDPQDRPAPPAGATYGDQAGSQPPTGATYGDQAGSQPPTGATYGDQAAAQAPPVGATYGEYAASQPPPAGATQGEYAASQPPPYSTGYAFEPGGQAAQAPPEPASGGGSSPFGGFGAAAAGGGAAAVGFLERLRDGADSGETGWDRNLATLAWIPFFGWISVVAYALSGSQMSRHARSHIAGAFNYALSTAILVFFLYTLTSAHFLNIGVAVFWWLLLTLAFAGVVYLLTKRNADGYGPIPHWIWFGAWVFVALMTAVTDFGIVAYPVVFGLPQLILIIFNAVRGRVGMEANFLGYPVIPILSQR